MGRIFSAEDFAKGRIPNPHDFSRVRATLVSRLESQDGVIGAVLCGSLLLRASTRRSDIDCLLVYDKAKEAGVHVAQRDITRFAGLLHVPLELIPLDHVTASSRLHHIGPSFYESLQRCVQRGGAIRSDPLGLFPQGHVSDYEDVRSYVQNKLRTFEKGICFDLEVSDPAHLKLIQKALESAVHIARKILWLENLLEGDDSATSVEVLFLQTANLEEARVFRLLRAMDREYSELLDDAMRSYHREVYIQGLSALRYAVQDALDFSRLMAKRLTSRPY